MSEFADYVDEAGITRLRATGGGGELPDPLTTPLNIELAADAVALAVTAAPSGGANLVEITPDNPASALAVDGFGRFRAAAFTFIASQAAPSVFSVPDGAVFRVDNDDTGDPILSVEAGTPNVVEVNGSPVGQTFPVDLANFAEVVIRSATTPTTEISFHRSGATLLLTLQEGGGNTLSLSTGGVLASDATTPFSLANAPEVPAVPTAQDVVDALVQLGLVTQAP